MVERLEELKNLQKDIEKQLKDYKEKSNTDKKNKLKVLIKHAK